MYGVRRHPIKTHRIQAGKAIVSITLAHGAIGTPGGYLLEWTGDAYELRDELDRAIHELERKHRLKQGEGK